MPAKKHIQGRQGQVFNLDIAQYWNALAINGLMNREPNMKAKHNLLLVSEKDSSPLPGQKAPRTRSRRGCKGKL